MIPRFFSKPDSDLQQRLVSLLHEELIGRGKSACRLIGLCETAWERRKCSSVTWAEEPWRDLQIGQVRA